MVTEEEEGDQRGGMMRARRDQKRGKVVVGLMMKGPCMYL
jgi:hypothetical protein